MEERVVVCKEAVDDEKRVSGQAEETASSAKDVATGVGGMGLYYEDGAC